MSVKKVLYGLLCVVIAGAITFTGCFFGIDSFNAWVKSKFKSGVETNSPEDIDDIVAVNSDGEALRAGCTYEMTDEIVLLSSDVAVDDTQVSAGGKGFTLTPTLSNEYINGEYDWSLEYVDPAPDQNTDVAINDCILLETGTDGKQAKIFSFRSFNCPIRLTVKLRGTDATDSCLFRCMKNVTIKEVSASENDFGNSTHDVEVFYGISENGILTGDLYLKRVTYFCNSDFQAAMQKYLKFDISFKEGEYLLNNSVASEDMLSNDLVYAPCTDIKFDYADFIVGFNDYDEAHKQAIYFAWYQAVQSGFYWNSMTIRLYYEYSYKGYKISDVDGETEEGCLVGANKGAGVIPNVTLNGNYVFT